MNKNLTDLTIIMDRSGSMFTCQQEAENGLNHLIEEQQKETGDCNFTLVRFDNEYDIVYDGVPIKDVQHVKLDPRGMTALNDAVGKTINTIGERLSKMNEEDRPGLVMVVIVTDGGENASQEFTSDMVKRMIETQQNQYQWKFTFLGANQDAFAESAKLGINPQFAANYDVGKSMDTMCIVSRKMSDMRFAHSIGQPVSHAYTDKERKEIQ
jgi:uncharacterized protein YegL